jgi:4-methylaminobutanoate oxidase (formaldehyde-forming)
VAGLAISPTIGVALATWVVDGRPPADLTTMSAMRFNGETWNEHVLANRNFYRVV